MKFASYLHPQFIFPDIRKETKEEVIQEMIRRIAAKDSNIKEKEALIQKMVLKREHEISTGIGEGVAIPHARIENFGDFIVAIAILEKPVLAEIGASNKFEEVSLVFLIISDVLKNKNILKVMSAISRIVMKNPDVFHKMKTEKNPSKIIDYIEETGIEISHKIIAEDVLSPDIIPVHPEDTLENVAKRFILEQKTGLPVVDTDGTFLGEITERELIEYGMPDYLSLMGDLNFLTVGEPFEEYLIHEQTTSIENLYRKDKKMIKIDRKTPIMEICFIMVYKGIHRLYVIDNGKYCGMITRSDIIKKVLHI
ncbi:phosphoenolpyruvate-dependent sugar phosphotransferase system, EIIA 2 [Fusobacterium necrophorum subsp. funduliforme ATCC 51357]|uniref:Nitrogen regulatory IIA protein n=5 Tax=Fusobacterium necrophorum TaxID=859 RepID=A0A162IXW9_9FUSO|nr:PTS sugar transporter subunit IIA [Fusobacterium necrophorum]AVQ21072.1 CBS domain-containing protein [Fusobacterium necrophorum subsp. funduliforme]AYV92778.1 CBS domain-containing protein [Fusobacterium necrophorum subsp. funduliforme]EIJ68009.1 phosphoenolpyruvate-dependent sugar phosphotransferase system, EIIA 2 [Fusobacterium necrophorum subsp. funduliforme ATCC 51357]EYD69585.1 nitrogen regulatory IIA protein [Fusobacterium necrophorum subsp. funduliforme B35]KAB0553894.1 CBS domain-c